MLQGFADLAPMKACAYLAGCTGGGGGICALFCSLFEATTSIFAGSSPAAAAAEPASAVLCAYQVLSHESLLNAVMIHSCV